MFCFIILNYGNYNLTLTCIQNIRSNILSDNYKIIVVDNNSKLSDDAIKKIKDTADDLIENDYNAGFAVGNNIGAEFAIKKYKPDFLININSDVFIKDSNFLNEILNLYKIYKFDILGPKIESPENLSFNPFPCFDTLKKINMEIKKIKFLIVIYKFFILRLIFKLYLNINHVFTKTSLSDFNGNKDEQNIALHGCCLIFSKKYYKKFENILYSNTFLYHEEEFLFYRIIKNKLISLYSPSIIVFHSEGGSSNKKGNKTIINKYKRRLNSLIKLRTLILDDNGGLFNEK